MAGDLGPDWLVAGRVARPHGLDGSFYVAQPAPGLLRPGRHVRVRGQLAEIVRRAGTDERPIVRLARHDGRDAATALRGEPLLAQRSDAPALGDDEWWASELEGCRVHDGRQAVGVVRRLTALPSCEVLEVAREGRPDLLVPLVADAVRAVDVAGRAIDVDLVFLGEG